MEIYYKKRYISSETRKKTGEDMETIGYIYAVVRKVMEKALPVDEALEMIRKVLG